MYIYIHYIIYKIHTYIHTSMRWLGHSILCSNCSKVPMRGALGSPPAEAMPKEMDKGTLTSVRCLALILGTLDSDGELNGDEDSFRVTLTNTESP